MLMIPFINWSMGMGRSDLRPVYVVDDDHMFRKSLVFYLSTQGYAVRPFSGGVEFLAEAGSLPPGCVVLDLRMPDMDGLQVLREMADLLEQLPVVFMTGHGEIATAVTAMREGAFDFLEKPCEEDRLLEAIAGAFAQLDRDKTVADERRRARKTLDSLTMREQDVLNRLARGQSNKIIAEMLSLSVRTVEMHRASMMHRLGVRTLSDALRIYHTANRPERLSGVGPPSDRG
jgi:two-component system, LuxR family, response regulator FixJ